VKLSHWRVLWAIGMVGTLLACGMLPAQAMDWQSHKGTTIRAMFSKGAITPTLEACLPDFEKETGIKVQYEVFPEDQFRQKILLELAAGTGALDVFWTMPAQEGLKYLRSGWYEPLDAYLKNPALTDPAYDLGDVSKAALKGNTFDGKLVGLPWHQSVTMLFYRKDLLAKHNLKVPQNFQELEEAAKRLHNLDEGGQKLVGIAMRGKRAAATTQWAPFMMGMGASWVGKDGKPAVNSAEAVKAFELYGGLLRKYGPPGAANYHWYETVSLFGQGKAALLVENSNRSAILEDAAKSQVAGKVGYALFPAGPAGRRPTLEVGSIAISSKSKKKEAAYLLAQWLTNRERAVRFLSKGIPVPRVSAWKDPRFLSQMPHKDWIEVSQKSLEIADAGYNPPVVAVSEVRDEVGAVIVSAILGENVKAAADKAAAEMAKIIEKTEKK